MNNRSRPCLCCHCQALFSTQSSKNSDWVQIEIWLNVFEKFQIKSIKSNGQTAVKKCYEIIIIYDFCGCYISYLHNSWPHLLVGFFSCMGLWNLLPWTRLPRTQPLVALVIQPLLGAQATLRTKQILEWIKQEFHSKSSRNVSIQKQVDSCNNLHFGVYLSQRDLLPF